MHVVVDGRCIHAHMGGIGRVAWELVREMGGHRGGHRISLLMGPRPLEGHVALEGVQEIQVQGAMIDEPFEQLQLPTLLDAIKTDVYLNPTFALPAVKTSRYQLAMIHDVVFEDHPEWVEPGLRSYLRKWARFSAESADHVLTGSDHSRERIRETYGLTASRITRVYHGVSPRCFASPHPGELSRIRRKFDLNGQFLLYIGTLEAKKGVPELLCAFAKLVGRGFPGILVLAGANGGFPIDLDGLIGKLGLQGRVRSLGYIDEDDKIPLLAACSAFTYPSLYEGFGLPPLEALALGVPCVVSRETSLPEVTGGAALLADVKDTSSFAEALDQALCDPQVRERARTEGPRRARQFSWDRAAKRVLEICERLEAA